MASRSSSRSSLALPLFLALAVWSVLAWRFDFVCDDAYISFRYARHLAEGSGLRFNPGESPPVEGYSNFLWVLWLALFERLGVDLSLVARLSSAACGAVLIAVVVRRVARSFDLPSACGVAVALFLACLPPMSMWSTSGLETMPFALAVFLAFDRLAGDADRPHAISAGAFSLAAALLRADGALWAGLALAAAVVAHRRLVRPAVVALAILAAGVAVHLVWRHGYYGEWIPNTARVKAGLSPMRLERGSLYVLSFALEVLPFALVPLAAVLVRPRSRVALAAAAFTAGAAAYAIFVGGDFMPMGRFLVPSLPFLALALAALLERIPPRPRAATAAAAVALALLPSLDVHPMPLAVRERLRFRWNEPEFESEIAMWRGMKLRAQEWIRLGRALRSATRPDESIVLGNIGAVGYATELVILDPFGLVDPEVAKRDAPLVRASPGHDKRVPFDFFLPRHPTYLSAWLSRTSVPLEAQLLPEWKPLVDAGAVELVREPLADEGSPPGVEVRLLRFRRGG